MMVKRILGVVGSQFLMSGLAFGYNYSCHMSVFDKELRRVAKETFEVELTDSVVGKTGEVMIQTATSNSIKVKIHEMSNEELFSTVVSAAVPEQDVSLSFSVDLSEGLDSFSIAGSGQVSEYLSASMSCVASR